MNFWPPVNPETIQCMQDVFTRKTFAKIDGFGRLQVIHALDNGQLKVDVARQFGVHPQTISYIYKQKDYILKKYKSKLISMKDVHSLNLDIMLLEWFKQQTRQGLIIFEENLKNKALEIISTSKNDFDCLDNWLLDFRQRHNIEKHLIKNDFNIKDAKELMKLVEEYSEENIYIAGTFGLSHKLELDMYLSDKKSNCLVSIMFVINSTGSDKKELLVIGSESVDDSDKVKSLPLQYYSKKEALISVYDIVAYFEKWDEHLKALDKQVALMLSLPDNFFEHLKLSNIKVVYLKSENVIMKTLDKMIYCLKYNYRKLQITRMFTYLKEDNPSILNYLNVIGLAWHNVPVRYVHQLFYPPPEDSLYLIEDETDWETKFSLEEWCKESNFPFNKQTISSLDKYAESDKHLQHIDSKINSTNDISLGDILSPEKPSSSAIEAFQAMRRLYSHLQSEGAKPNILKSARSLENHIEYGALMEINDLVPENSTNNEDHL